MWSILAAPFSVTAGFRETADVIETMGIERSYLQLGKAEIILLVTDLSSEVGPIFKRIHNIREKITDQHLIIIANKVDIALEETKTRLSGFKLFQNESLVFLAAKNRDNLDQLIRIMTNTLNLSPTGSDDIIVSNVRHYEALSLALNAIKLVIEGLNSGITGDFLAQDIRECLHYLGEITGEITTDETLGYIFKNFCIGK